MSSLVLILVLSLDSTTPLINALELFISKNVSAIKLTRFDAVHPSFYFLTRRDTSAESTIKLETLSSTPLSFSSMTVSSSCRARRALVLMYNDSWSNFQTWRLAFIVSIYYSFVLLTCIWAMPFLGPTFQLTWTEIEVWGWDEFNSQMHAPLLLTVAVRSELFRVSIQ